MFRRLLGLLVIVPLGCGQNGAAGSGIGGSGIGGAATGGDSTSSIGGSSGGQDAAASGGDGTSAGASSNGGGSSGGGGDDSSTGGSPEEVGGASSGGDGGAATTGGAPSGGADGSGGGGAVGTGGLGGVVPSAGCNVTTALQSGTRTIDVNGTQREYILDVPASSDSPSRLIFGFHGLMYNAQWVAEGGEPLTGPFFGIQEEAVQAGQSVVFVAPQALSGGWPNQDGRDVAFVRAMVAEITAGLCIDESRMFASGFSFGAILTVTLGCEMADVFRAIAPMSASLQDGCPASTESIGYLATHGLQDNTIKISEGEKARDEFLSRNHCGSTTSAPDANGCVSYVDCPEETPVSWCTFMGEHVPAPFAGPVIWQFFSQF